MSNDRSHRREISENIAAILDSHEKTLYHVHERENVSNLSIPVLQKKIKKMNEQQIFFRAENRLLSNYLTWYEKKVLPNQNQEVRKSIHIHLTSQPNQTNEIKPSPHPIRQLLSIQKKREIAEVSFKVLLAYSHKYELNTNEYVDRCIDDMETDEETIAYFELELMALQKFIQKINGDLHDTQKRLSAEELAEFLREQIRAREALDERKRQKTVRLRFKINRIERSIRKVCQIVDTVTEVDFEQIKIDLDKQLKELNVKNKLLVVYKRQLSEANMKLNTKKPELFQQIRALTTLRNATNSRSQQLIHSDQTKVKMEKEIVKYERSNEPLRQMTLTSRVPAIIDYVDLKSKQLHLYRQEHAWKRKVQIAERELHLRQTDLLHNPEKVLHPWKYLQNPSPILFYRNYKTAVHRDNEQNETKKFDLTLPKQDKPPMFNIIA